MKYSKFGDLYVVRPEVGEDISDRLLSLAEKENIGFASVSGIGATDDFLVGIFNLETKKYDEHRYTGNHEITALCGSLSRMGGKPYAHLHISCANSEGTLVGGHLIKSRISLTCEIVLQTANAEVGRVRDEALGLNLLDV